MYSVVQTTKIFRKSAGIKVSIFVFDITVKLNTIKILGVDIFLIYSTRDQQQIIDIEVGISQVQKLLQRLILQFKTSYYIYVFIFFPTIKKKKEKEIK
jgi:hypothetical protein